MDKGKWIRLVLIPIIIGLIATLIVRQLLTPAAQAPEAAPVETVKVVAVADGAAIALRTKISDGQLTLKPVPSTMLTGLEFQAVADVVGKISLIQLEPGEVILSRRVVAEGQGDLPYRVPRGKRAVTLRMDELNGVAGYPEPGDLVDLVFVLPARQPERPETTARLLLEAVPVLAKGPAPDVAGPKAASAVEAPQRLTSLTLALTPEQAVEVSLAEQIGVIKFLLRPALTEGNNGRITTSEGIYR